MWSKYFQQFIQQNPQPTKTPYDQLPCVYSTYEFLTTVSSKSLAPTLQIRRAPVMSYSSLGMERFIDFLEYHFWYDRQGFIDDGPLYLFRDSGCVTNINFASGEFDFKGLVLLYLRLSQLLKRPRKELPPNFSLIGATQLLPAVMCMIDDHMKSMPKHSYHLVDVFSDELFYRLTPEKLKLAHFDMQELLNQYGTTFGASPSKLTSARKVFGHTNKAAPTMMCVVCGTVNQLGNLPNGSYICKACTATPNPPPKKP